MAMVEQATDMERSRILLGAAAALVPAAAVFGADLYGLQQAFTAVCHQLTDRGLPLGSWQPLLCARCLGLWLGLACGALLPARVPGALPALCLAVSLLLWLTGLDWPWLRFIGGFALAAATIGWAFPLVASPRTVRQTDSRA